MVVADGDPKRRLLQLPQLFAQPTQTGFVNRASGLRKFGIAERNRIEHQKSTIADDLGAEAVGPISVLRLPSGYREIATDLLGEVKGIAITPILAVDVMVSERPYDIRCAERFPHLIGMVPTSLEAADIRRPSEVTWDCENVCRELLVVNEAQQ